MSDIFISYSSLDRGKAKQLATALMVTGWSVWWDRTIPAGKEFDDVIEEAIDQAKCMIVFWSKNSVASRWVKTEAAEGAERHILIPVLIENVKIPLAFKRIQAADLIGWDGDITSDKFSKLVADISTIIGPPPEGNASQKPEQTSINTQKDKSKEFDRTKLDYALDKDQQIKDVQKNIPEDGHSKHAAEHIVNRKIRKYYQATALFILIIFSITLIVLFSNQSTDTQQDVGKDLQQKKEDEQKTESSTQKIQEMAGISQKSSQKLDAEQKAAELLAEKQQRQEKIYKYEAEIAGLLGKAREAMADHRLTTPENNNAVLYYREILELDPASEEALAGLVEVEKQYVSWLEQALAEHKIDKSVALLDKLRLVNPAHPEIMDFDRKIERLRKQVSETDKIRAVQEEQQTQKGSLRQPGVESVEQRGKDGEYESQKTVTVGKLDGDEIKKLLLGNTAEGKFAKWGTTHKTYFDPTGKLRRIDNLNNKESGFWAIDNEGHLCIEIGRRKCNTVKRRPDGGYDVYRAGELRHTYDKIVKGNPYNL